MQPEQPKPAPITTQQAIQALSFLYHHRPYFESHATHIQGNTAYQVLDQYIGAIYAAEQEAAKAKSVEVLSSEAPKS